MSGATFEVDPSWPTIEELAVRLWGKVTGRYQGGNELRFGAKESKSVRLRELTWFDNETQEGGGYIRLWSQLYPGTPLPPRTGIPRPTPRPNGHDATGAGKPNGKHAPRDPNRPPVWEDVGPVQYDYHDATGTTVLQVYRTISGAPRFRQRSPNGTYRDGKPKWKYKVQHVPGHDTMLYHFPELLQSGHATVFITEGEKDCDNVIKLGLNATTNIGGAGKWRRENARWFLRKPVVILADNDPQSVHQVTGEPLWHPDGRPVLVGQDHAEDVASALYGTAMSVKVLHLPGLPIKGDVSDWIEAGGTRDELERLARDLDEWTPPPEPPAPEQPPATDTDGPRGPEPPTPDDPGGGRDDDGNPIITCIAGEFPRMVRQAEAALFAAGVAIYQRGALVQPAVVEYDAATPSGSIVKRKTHAASLVEIKPPKMLLLLSRVATWMKYDARSEAFKKVHPPKDVVEILLANKGEWSFPVIRGILTTPTIRSDGTLLTAPGYDPGSRYFLSFPSNLVLPEIPDKPTREDAEVALKRLDALLDGYEFLEPETGVYRAVALTMLMTQVLRCGMEVSPMLAVSATAPGSGKSHLVDLAATIATGRWCPVMNAGKDDNETEKGLNTKLMSGVPGFSIDNVHKRLDLEALNTATERPLLQPRNFGTLTDVLIENGVVIYMTGNNLEVIDEQIRRTMMCKMDVAEEQPEQRDFPKGDPINTVLADRGRYVADVLIIARAYLAHIEAGGEKPEIRPYGSYPDWDRFVRQPLVWLDQADPLDSQKTLRADDPVKQRRTSIIEAWREAFPDNHAMTLAEVVRFATTPAADTQAYTDDDAVRAAKIALQKVEQEIKENLLNTLREAFPAGRDSVNTVQMAAWMRKFASRKTEGWRFVKTGEEGESKHKGGVHWKLQKVG